MPEVGHVHRVAHQAVGAGVGPGDQRGSIDAGDGGKDGVMVRTEKAALAQGDQDGHRLRRDVVGAKAIDDDDQDAWRVTVLCVRRSGQEAEQEQERSKHGSSVLAGGTGWMNGEEGTQRADRQPLLEIRITSRFNWERKPGEMKTKVEGFGIVENHWTMA